MYAPSLEWAYWSIHAQQTVPAFTQNRLSSCDARVKPDLKKKSFRDLLVRILCVIF
jgi:hypothetical protein